MNELEKIGQAFVNLVMVSRLLGHRTIADTAIPYLLGPDMPYTPEQFFVLRAVTSPADEVISDEVAKVAGAVMVNQLAVPGETLW